MKIYKQDFIDEFRVYLLDSLEKIDDGKYITPYSYLLLSLTHTEDIDPRAMDALNKVFLGWLIDGEAIERKDLVYWRFITEKMDIQKIVPALIDKYTQRLENSGRNFTMWMRFRDPHDTNHIRLQHAQRDAYTELLEIMQTHMYHYISWVIKKIDLYEE